MSACFPVVYLALEGSPRPTKHKRLIRWTVLIVEKNVCGMRKSGLLYKLGKLVISMYKRRNKHSIPKIL
jgi:hypothetical protein